MLGNEFGKDMLGMSVKIPPQEEQIIQITYQLGNTIIPDSTSTTYMLYLQKQSGITDMPIEISILYPEVWKIDHMMQGTQQKNNTLLYQTIFNKDVVLAVSFHQ